MRLPENIADLLLPKEQLEDFLDNTFEAAPDSLKTAEAAEYLGELVAKFQVLLLIHILETLQDENPKQAE